MSNWPPRPAQYITPTAPYTLPPTTFGRPAIITAVAVFSVILGGLGILANIVFLFIAMILQNFAAPHHATSTPPPLPPPPQAVSEYIAPSGLGSAQRQAVIDGLTEFRPLSAVRRQRVNALLADAGKKIFPLSEKNLTPQRIAASITSAREILGEPGAPPDVEYILGTGRLQIGDRTALFFSTGSPAPIRSEGGSFTDSSGAHLATVQINGVIQRVQELCNNAMNSTQFEQLQQELQKSGQLLIAPVDSAAGAVAQVKSAQLLPDGTIGITTNTNSISIGPAGELAGGIMPAAGYNPTGKMPQAPRSATAGMYLLTLISCGLAAFLLVIGILTLKASPWGRRMHLIYAVVKIIVVAADVWISYIVYAALSTSGSAGNPARSLSIFVIFLMVAAILGLIYPIAVLLLMNTRIVREFYNTATVGRAY